MGGTIAVAAAGVSLWVTGSRSAVPAPRARVYSSFQACLLTGSRGIADPQAAPAWAGMEDASSRTHAMISYLAVAGPATKANALPFLGSLLVRRCGVIVAVGAAERAAAVADAARFPKARFVVTGTSVEGPVGGANLTTVTAGEPGLRAAVAAVVGADASSAGS